MGREKESELSQRQTESFSVSNVKGTARRRKCVSYVTDERELLSGGGDVKE